MKKGKLIIFSAPSGAGKSTIISYLMKDASLGLEFSVSATSRNPRPGEKNGEDYYFLSPDEFRARIAAGDFVEYEEVYEDTYYGTLKSELQRLWKHGKNVVFDVDVVGGLNLKKAYPDESLTLFIMPESVDVLRRRLVARQTETMDKIDMRIAKAEKEMSCSKDFDRIIINDALEKAVEEAREAVKEAIKV